MSKETSSTALRSWRGERSMTRFSQGRETSNTFERLRTCRRGPAASAMDRALTPVRRRLRGNTLGRMQPAGRERAVGDEKVGPLHPAPVEDAGATRVEGASGRYRIQARHRPF